MKVLVLSQNLQGLDNIDKTSCVRNYMRKHLANLDISCFEKHKLRRTRLLALKDQIWATTAFFGQEANLNYNNTIDEDGARYSGVCIRVAPGIKHLIVDSGHSRWIAAGWNFVESRGDKSNAVGRILWDSERMIFTQFLKIMDLEDNFPFSNSIQFRCL